MVGLADMPYLIGDMKLGDAIATIATPIARTFNIPCIDPQTNNLRSDSGCAKRTDAINRFGDALYDIFWPQVDKPADK